MIFIFFPYFVGILFANLIDIIDWIILRLIHIRMIKKENIDWKHNPFFPKAIEKIRKYTLFWLPNWNYEKKQYYQKY